MMEIELIKDSWSKLLIDIKNNKKSSNISLTIWVPFCGQKCKFCNCYTRKWNKETILNFMKLFEEQVNVYSELFKEYEFNTLLLIGGSPASLGYSNLVKLFDLIYKNFNLSKVKFFLFEADTHYTTPHILGLLKERGVGVISLGVQSINDKTLEKISRFQTKDEISLLATEIKNRGFLLNLDLIGGLPGENLEDFKKSLDFVYNLESDLINMYRFDLSNNTDFYKEGIFKTVDQKNADNIFKYVNEYFSNEGGVIKKYIDGGYRMTTYFKNPLHALENDRRQTGSVLALGYGTKSIIFGDLEYYSKVDDYIFSFENIDDIFSNIKIDKLQYRDFILKYFIFKFTSNINLKDFFNIFKVNLVDILEKEIVFLIKKNKLKLKEGILYFNFKNDDELIIYQKIMYSGII